MNHAEFVTQLYQAALAAGMSDAAARVTASQGAVESGYGAHAPGNNFFGIKAGNSWTGPTQTLPTREVINGKSQTVNQKFRVYATPEEGLADRIHVMDRAFPGFSQSATVGDAYNSLQNGRYGRYATADRAEYEGALNHVNSTYLGGTPVPPGNVPGSLSASGNLAKGTNFAVAGAPLPEPPLLAPPPLPRARPDPAALKASNIYQQMPQDASYGIQQRLVPGQKTAVPTDFQALMPLERPDARALSLTQPFAAPFVSEDHPRSNAVPSPKAAIKTNMSPAGSVAMSAPRPPSIPVPPSTLQLLGKPANSSGSPDDRGTTVPSMPSRPPVLTAPIVPPQAAPPPIPQQSTPIMPPAPQRAPMVTLSSGKQIAPGVYNQGDHNVQVSDDGTGHAKIDIVRGPMAIPGLIDPMKEAGAPTLAGALIRNQVPQAMAQGYAGIKNNIGSTLQGFGSSIGSAFGGLFGQPAPRPWAPAGQFVFPQMQRPPVMAPRPMQRPLSLFSIAPGVASMAPVQQQSAVGAQFLNTQGINTQGLTIGQQANELNKALAGSSRNSDGSRGFM